MGRKGVVWLTMGYHAYEQERHETSFSVVQEVLEPKPFFGLSSNLPFLAFPVPLWEQGASIGEMVQEILDNEGTFGDSDSFSGSRRSDSEDWGFPESVDLLELRRS